MKIRLETLSVRSNYCTHSMGIKVEKIKVSKYKAFSWIIHKTISYIYFKIALKNLGLVRFCFRNRSIMVANPIF